MCSVYKYKYEIKFKKKINKKKSPPNLWIQQCFIYQQKTNDKIMLLLID